MKALYLCRNKQPGRVWCCHMSIKALVRHIKLVTSKTTCQRLRGVRARALVKGPWATSCMCATVEASMTLTRILRMTWISKEPVTFPQKHKPCSLYSYLLRHQQTYINRRQAANLVLFWKSKSSWSTQLFLASSFSDKLCFPFGVMSTVWTQQAIASVWPPCAME